MLIEQTPRGLYCDAGGFYIDPHLSVERAIVTHGHTDHARGGMKSYLTSRSGEPIVRRRVGVRASIETLEFGEQIKINDVTVSLHPAGHILGSAQVRVEHKGEVWVVSGDYKTEPDQTCETFEPVRCDTFITESTFAQPKYKWRPQSEIFARINDWWQLNAMWGRATVLFGYSLGKAQRLLAGADPSIGPILVYHTVDSFCTAYKLSNITFPEYQIIDESTIANYRGKGALIIAPSEIRKTGILDLIGEYETGFASGWMLSKSSMRSMMYDAGFALSDHADWEGLLSAIKQTGAHRIFSMHGFTDTLTTYLKTQGYDAHEMR